MSVVFTGRLWSNGEWRFDKREYYISKYTGQRLISITPNTVLALEQEDISNINSYGRAPTYNIGYVLVQEYRRLHDLGESNIDVRICMDSNDPTHHYIKFNGGGNSVIWYVNENASASINGCILYPVPDDSCHPLMWTTADNINEISPLHSETAAYFGCIEYLGGYNKVIRSDITQVMADASIVAGVSNPFEYSLTEYNDNEETREERRVGHKLDDAPCYAIIGQNYFGGTYWNSGFRLIGPTANSVSFNVDVYDRGQYTGTSPGSTPTRLEYNGKYYYYSGSGTLAWGQTGYENFENPQELTVLDLINQSSSISNWLDLIGPLIDLHTVEASEPIYFVLSYKYVPGSDVSPDDIPPEDKPPVPPQPDDDDPYYDPTSDPNSPDYDPTKDPSSPDYDPDSPHPPFTPPSTEGGGGDPDPQPPQDEIPAPETPPSYVTTNALFTLYNPSGADLNNLAAFLWSPAWSIDTFKKIFANPLDCILGLMVMPYLEVDVATKNMAVGNIDSGVAMRYFTTQFCDFDCGDFTIEEYYKSYLDYAPYTKINIFLPYIGDQQLNADEVMSKTINVKYRFDLATGDCVAFVSVEGSVLYSFSGNCAARLPLSASNYGGLLPSITGAIVAAGSMAAGVPALGAASALAVSSMKQDIRHTGSLSGSAGLMGVQTPYLIITRPRQALPIGQNSFTGYPSFITESLGGLVGYTEVESCHLEHVPCTDEELREIENLLKGGVLF